ncbi:hypothetical protein GCM10009715_19340 [Paeniglutamicibacter psychrophenolicus]|uniref:Uncharacterized protein n=1 Tax=Paeniglutamicibacter psychrophenolicus TaxID=257454 RepID=A0ABS4WK97_9MICC|nr:hypothetical protein [Paeniglutamicibacter psychrophenolicus]MBP2376388.1 hypothetical protein [Paeniglutamicibacter psychrophenolicus]
MKKALRGAGMASVLLAALLLASCAEPVSVAERTAPELPGSLTQAQRGNLEPGEPATFWLQAGSRFALVTWGSSSCPAVVTRMDAMGADAIELRVESSGGSGPCSADLAPTTHELELPESVTRRPVTLTLHYADGPDARTLVLD